MTREEQIAFMPTPNSIETKMIIEKPPGQLALEDIRRQVLEAAAKRLESHACGIAYRKAFDRAAEIIREMKPQ